MKKGWMVTTVLMLSVFFGACGGGGGGGGGDTPQDSAPTVLNGTASKGPISGRVEVYALGADGIPGSLLNSALTDHAGNYTINLGSYSGPVLVQAFGKYVDEATGESVTILSSAPLRAALAQAVSGENIVAVTPLTELAARRAEARGGLTAERISQAKEEISSLFGFDVLATRPVPPESNALASASAQEKNYTFALATLSQMCSDPTQNLEQVIAGMAGDLADDRRFSRETLESYDRAAVNFFQANPNNRTGLTDALLAGSRQVGRRPIALTLSLANTTVPIHSMDIVLSLPEGFYIATDSNGEPAQGVIKAEGNFIVMAKYLGAEQNIQQQLALKIASATEAIPTDNFVTISASYSADALPVVGTFDHSLEATDLDTNPISGARLSFSTGSL